MYKKTLTKVSERYEAPSIEVLSVSMEGVLCQSGVFGAADEAGDSMSESSDYTYNF